jgi:trimeric autotransporter adhesin
VPGQTFAGTQLDISSTGAPIITSNGTSLLSTTGIASVFLGPNAGGSAATGTQENVGIGSDALESITTGSSNTAIGGDALFYLTGGIQNTAAGYLAGYNMTTGNYNSAFGVGALYFNATGTSNTAVGSGALNSVAMTNDDTAIGSGAGGNDVGSNNTWLGALTGPSDASGISYSTAIGYGATVSQNFSMALGGQGSSALNVGIGTGAPHSRLEIASQGGSGINFVFPSPSLTLTAESNGTPSIDFNTAGIATAGTYNPGMRIAVLPEASGNVLAIYANKGTGLNQGLQQIFAIDSAGNAAVTGTLSKAGGSFRIDDPIDPGGKYLSHSFVESPDMKNIYDGVVTLDAHGSGVVTMPEWFDALNRDFRYQLTAIGAPGPKLYVAEEMKGNTFRIAGGKKGQRVSWQVTGIRQDAWANAHRIPTEEAKPAAEQGTYLHPELFGAGPEKAIGASAVVSANGAAPPAASASTQVAGRE